MNDKKIKLIAIASSVLIVIILIILISDSSKNNTAAVNNPKNKANVTEVSETKPKIDKNDELLILVNYKHPLPDDYKVDLVDTENELQIDKRAAEPLKKMLDDCRKAGHEPYMRSAYRTLAVQRALYNKKVRKYRNMGYSQEEAEKKTAEWIAVPGTSEHHLGLAVDVVDEDYKELDEKQEEQDTQKWLMENSWKYGFILRYPTSKKAITHINYEPWHYRYVGKENAKKIYDSGLTLEEYLDME